MFPVFFRRLTVVFAALSFAFAPLASAAVPKVGQWKGYIGIDAMTGKTLVQENPDVVTPPASMTKLMTYAVLYDKLQSGALSLSTPIKVTAEDSKIGGTQVYLDPSETFTVEEMVYALMIQSANDCAHALARSAAGSVEAFVQLMNAKAAELGMTHTTFRSPHGLPPTSRKIADGDLTTPRDFALLSRHLVLKTDVLKYTSVRERDFGPLRAKGPQHMINHNKLMGRVDGVDGLKTGYTFGAGYCLSATALRNNHRVIVVIMGAFGPQGKIDLGASRDRKVIELLSSSFAALPADAPAFVGKTWETPVSPVSVSPVAGAPGAGPAPAEDEPMVKFNFGPKKK
jgi:D-alanyl-D-alanine carboxypeptidase (penicillin-binding protein 5/6)